MADERFGTASCGGNETCHTKLSTTLQLVNALFGVHSIRMLSYRLSARHRDNNVMNVMCRLRSQDGQAEGAGGALVGRAGDGGEGDELLPW